MRKALAVMVLLLTTASWSVAAERMALGLIVKMKDGTTQSVVRLQAAAMSREQPQQVRMRLAKAAHKAGISYMVDRPTAFAANVIHNGRPIRLKDARAQAARLRLDPDVEWVVVNELEQPHAMVFPNPPNDSSYAQQRWLTSGATGGLPNVPAAWTYLGTQTLQPVVVAVLDTGILRHPDLSNRVLYQDGYDFVSEVDYANDGNGMDDDATDPGDYLTSTQISQNPSLYTDCSGPRDSSWHGTEIAGILAAETNNNLGIAGILASLPGSPVLPVRVAGQCGAAVIDIIEGMLWAAGINYNGRPKVNNHPARVINLSFGGSGGCTCDRTRRDDAGNCLYQDAIDTLKQKGVILVASAGNASQANVNGGTETSRPASCRGALAVTALNINGQKARYANFVPATGIATMGGDPNPSVNTGDNSIYTTTNIGPTGPSLSGGVPTDDYRTVPGTSFSAPIVAGTVALMWAVNPGLSADALLAGLRGSGTRPHVTVAGAGACSAVASSVNSGSCSCTSATCGAGILDVNAAVQWAASQPITAYVEPSVTATFFNANLLRGGSSSNQNNGGGGKSGGGGGGAFDAAGLLAGALFTAALARSRRSRRD